jgi:hypothetical protein
MLEVEMRRMKKMNEVEVEVENLEHLLCFSAQSSLKQDLRLKVILR